MGENNHFDGVMKATNHVVEAYCKLPLTPENLARGGYLMVFRQKKLTTGDCELIMMVAAGDFIDWKIVDYLKSSYEKARRLIRHPNHLSSWQSRDKKEKKLGGAIRTTDYTLSFEGNSTTFSEKGCEAISLVIAIKLKMMNYDDAVAIAELSKNHIFDELHKLVFYGKK